MAEGLAQRIVSDDVPESLKGKRVLALDVGGLVAGTRFRGDFEERMQQMLKELQQEEKDISCSSTSCTPSSGPAALRAP